PTAAELVAGTASEPIWPRTGERRRGASVRYVRVPSANSIHLKRTNRAGQRSRRRRTQMRLFHDPVCPKPAITLSRKGLAFGREQSGTVTVPGARRALGILPRRLHGRDGAVVVAAMTPHQRNGGSRWEDSPIPNSSFCPQLRGAMIAELTCRQTLRAKRFERPWISSSALGCLKRSAPMARSWPGDAMLKLDPLRFASRRIPRPEGRKEMGMLPRLLAG